MEQNKYQLLFIYNCDYDFERTFTFVKMELALENGLIITGEHTGSFVKDVYEICNQEKTTNTEAFKKGMVIKYCFNTNNTNDNNLRVIVENTYLNLLTEYDIKRIDDKKDIVSLDKVIINISDEEKNYIKKEHTSKIAEMIFYNKLFMIKQKQKTNRDVSTIFEEIPAKKTPNVKINNSEKNNQNIKKIIFDLKRKVVSQDSAINSIVPAIFINQKLATLDNPDLVKTQKNAILISGSTGTGKTLIVEELCKMLDIPMVVRGITNYSTVGYKGEDLNNILLDLYNEAGQDLEKAQRGVVCLDEIDKLGAPLEIRKGISHELLTWLNGTIIRLNESKNNEIIFDTSKLTIIGLGAFEKMREEKKTRRTIGFNTNENEIDSFTTEDFIKIAGMQRELMGRFNCIATTKDFTLEDLIKILTDSDLSPLKSFVELANLYNVKIDYDEAFIEKIAIKAYEDNIGARALQRQMNNVKNEFIIDILAGDIDYIDLSVNKHKKTLEL